MVGKSLLNLYSQSKHYEVIVRNKTELDLMNQAEVHSFFKKNLIDTVIIAAAKVGGIKANNQYRAEFIYNNLQIQNNLIHGAHLADVQHLLFLGSSCIYPKLSKQPIKESYLLSGPLEETNEPYAIAKIAGLKMCEAYNAQYNRNYFTVMPTNLYGPNDNFDPETSHVLPALIRKFYEAKIHNKKSITLWGSGTPKREFLHVSDLSRACKLLLEQPSSFDSLTNVGYGSDIQIKELAKLIAHTVDYDGEILFNNKLDGTPRKLMDSSKIFNLGWSPEINLEDGIKLTYDYFIKTFYKYS